MIPLPRQGASTARRCFSISVTLRFDHPEQIARRIQKLERLTPSLSDGDDEGSRRAVLDLSRRRSLLLFLSVLNSSFSFSLNPSTPLSTTLQSTAPAKESNPLYERRPKSFGVGGAPPPKGADLHRWVKWPRYVRLQRQRRVLNQRLKVPPALARFAKAADRNLAASAFKLLLKYRPEDKAEKKARLVAEAEARASGSKDTDKKKKPVVVKFGLNHVTDLVESGKAKLVVIAHDVDPIELVVWLPALCKKVGVPYLIVKGKARLGAVVHQKTAAALALTEVKGEDDRELAKVVESANALFLNGARVGWGGGIMGVKSQAKTKAKERELARELAQRA